MTRLLAIDFGLNNFGLAICEGELVEPLVQFKINNPFEAREKIKAICQKNKIDKIILGLPEGKIQQTVISFGQKLRQVTGLPLELQPEDFTSKNAIAKMIEAGKPLHKRQTQEHLVAACLILQDYLDDQI